MTVVGFHASHEQVHPAVLLRLVQAAEEAGFTGAMCSDHFAPWSESQGHSGFAWAWLGAAMQATDLPLGVVNAPGQRYHPAIIAQAAATLEAMHSGRFWVALGSGQLLNEHITGDPWPRKDVREARLLECVEVMRALFAGEEVSHDGLVSVDRATLHTRPDSPPPLVAAAVTPRTAAWVAGWADGLATINRPVEELRPVVDAYRDAGGRGRLVLQVHLAWDPDEEAALALAHDQWRTNALRPPLPWEIATPGLFDEAARFVPPEALRESVLVSADPGRHAAWIAEMVDLGFDEVYLHHVAPDEERQRAFLDVFADRVLPELGPTARAA
jgi:probable non-F420 flavinoid oxidoreductase